MNDTPEAVRRRYRSLLMARPAADRLRMGCDMFDAARTLVLAGVVATGEPSPRAAIFLRTYGADFDAETRRRILIALGA
jgi:hypothetical protein